MLQHLHNSDLRLPWYFVLRFGGWVVDGFPHTREQWSVMLEQQVVPDHVVVLTEPDGKEGALLERIKAEAAGDGTVSTPNSYTPFMSS